MHYYTLYIVVQCCTDTKSRIFFLTQ